MPRQLKGKPFPWQVSRQEVERLQQVEKQYIRMRTTEYLEPFIAEFKHSMMVLLATKAYADWPAEAKVVMEYMKREQKWSLMAGQYLELLPKESF